MHNELVKRIISSIILIPIAFFFIIKGSYLFCLFLLPLFLISSYEWYSMSKNKLHHFYGYIFLIISFYCVYKLRMNNDNNFWPFLIVVIACILTDIGGFLFGKIFKGPKLIKYSPNKTYSGLIGGFLLSFALIPFLIFFKFNNDIKILNLFVFVFLISFTSQFGDIIISYFKRISKIKDTGKIIPGHGGLLDRIDGMLFAFPIAYILKLTTLFNKIL